MLKKLYRMPHLMVKRIKRTNSRAIILLYHRVLNLVSDPQLLCVTPKHFAEQLDILRQYTYPMPLRKFINTLQNRKIPRRSVVITFDDGYADNLYEAKPILQKFDIPATIFIATGSLGEEKEFWWDELERIFLRQEKIPETFQLKINGTVYNWELGKAAHYNKEVYRKNLNWNVLESNDPGPRQKIYRSLCELVRPMPETERSEVLDEIRSWAGVESTCRQTHRMLNPNEVSNLEERGLIEVGAHTVTHPVLSALEESEQKAEIEESKAKLEEVLEHPVSSFSYPYGSRSDYTKKTVALVRKAGFVCACSNFPDAIWRFTDRFQLPRFVVRDWDGDEFRHHLQKWFG